MTRFQHDVATGTDHQRRLTVKCSCEGRSASPPLELSCCVYRSALLLPARPHTTNRGHWRAALERLHPFVLSLSKDAGCASSHACFDKPSTNSHRPIAVIKRALLLRRHLNETSGS